MTKTKNERQKRWHHRNPWARFLIKARQRCNNKNHEKYHLYGGRGIQCRLTLAEVYTLYIRDKAGEMKQPSIDRIDPDGHYEFGNCRFLELPVNRSLHRPCNSAPNVAENYPATFT